MSGRHRAPARRPAKGAPLTLAEHFWWTLIVGGLLMVGVVTVSYLAQANTPGTRTVCESRWGCTGPADTPDTPIRLGATP